tara:strand:- start:2030 stop:3091 length:1062 start_codon:yes stop_codon:yes gene_type:complete
MKKWNLGVIGVLLVMLSSCETDVELIQDYEQNSFIFGLLDQHVDTQFVRVNKAFLGTLSIEEMAAIGDSINYQPGDLKVELNLKSFFNLQGRILPDRDETVELQELTVSKSTGLFNNDDYTVFYTTTAIPQEENNVPVDYELIVTNLRTGKVISGKTQLIEDTRLDQPNPNSSTVSFSKLTPNGFIFQDNFNVEWKSKRNAVKHEVYVRFYYDEINLSTSDTTYNSFDYFAGTAENPGGNSGASLFTVFDPLNFFKEIGRRLEVKTGIERIRPRIQIYMIIANQDFSLYVDASSPSNDINQNKPSYSNLSNGLGIFGARNSSFVTTRDLRFNQSSLDLLLESTETRDLSFKPI